MQDKRELKSMMVAGFRRSLSFPVGPNPCASPCRRPYTSKPFHSRSTSLPCRSHPILAHLEDELQSLRSLPPHPSSAAADCSSATWLADGLNRIDRAHAALSELLHETPLRSHPTAAKWANRLLDDALRLADAYAALRSAAASLKQHVAEARAAIRRCDSARLSSAVRSHRCAGKELARLAGTVKNLITRSTSSHFSMEMMGDAAEVEVAGIVREVVVATATASAAIFAHVTAVSSSVAAAAASTSKDCFSLSIKRITSPRLFKKEREMQMEEAEIVAFEQMEGLEECMERLEEGSERVFRSLVNTRVKLLNNLTPTF